jgi:hypothetical protein
LGSRQRLILYLTYWFPSRRRGSAEEQHIEDSRYRLGDWPLSDTQDRSYYLHNAGQANTLHGEGTLSSEPPGEILTGAFCLRATARYFVARRVTVTGYAYPVVSANHKL